jgi:hypothetical protein
MGTTVDATMVASIRDCPVSLGHAGAGDNTYTHCDRNLHTLSTYLQHMLQRL